MSSKAPGVDATDSPPVSQSFAQTPASEPPISQAPASQPPVSQPPPLPESASRVPPARAAIDAAFAERMLERLAASDYAGALMAAEALLLHQPRHADALDCAQMARSELRKTYIARIGSVERAPFVAMRQDGLVALGLDFRHGFVLARVDGRTTVRQIVESSGAEQLDTLRILSELALQRAIAFKD